MDLKNQNGAELQGGASANEAINGRTTCKNFYGNYHS
ncbi:hypothetical protein Mucpa_5707 [Mucilaginibacter paludis DSM 18603]|uniref:Uncharacterized protein n=1 Tax=Mucilaginibacter paludis DSM 18603 TaxID=714943 RepID=H1Y3K8_9SPHI|nr:hypothetical protein Mucpa_5707 [Mucilaginibacter paludis DSM 18603]